MKLQSHSHSHSHRSSQAPYKADRTRRCLTAAKIRKSRVGDEEIPQFGLFLHPQYYSHYLHSVPFLRSFTTKSSKYHRFVIISTG